MMILNLLVDDSSMWSISRTVGVSINTITKLLVRLVLSFTTRLFEV